MKLSTGPNERHPVIYEFQDNGYGISVPKKDQTANRKWPITSPALRTSASFIAMERMYLTR